MALHQQAADEVGSIPLGGAGVEGWGEVLGGRGGYEGMLLVYYGIAVVPNILVLAGLIYLGGFNNYNSSYVPHRMSAKVLFGLCMVFGILIT